MLNPFHPNFRLMREETPTHRYVLKEIPESVKSILGDNVWLAGGALRDIYSGHKKVRDFDIFFKDVENKEDVIEEVRQSLKRDGWDFAKRFKNADKEVIMETLEHKNLETPLQLIRTKYYQDPCDLLRDFNFTINQFATDGEEILLGEETLWDLHYKVLNLVRLKRPESFMRKLHKYIKYGYEMSPLCITTFLTNVALGNYDSEDFFQGCEYEEIE